MFGLKKRLDFVGIGDTVTDTFIELIDAWIENDNPQKTRELCMRFGDKIPYTNEVTIYGTGNANNATHAAMKLGLKTGVITNIGDDGAGDETLKHFSKNGISIKNVFTHQNKNTNHNFILRYQADRTILINHNEFDYHMPRFSRGAGPKWIYLSSLASNSISFHNEIAKFLKEHPETKLAFQPGTFQIKLGTEKITDIYRATEIFFCNKEEAQKILGTNDDSFKNLLTGIRALGPKIVVITDGPAGSYTYDGSEFLHGSMYPDIAPPVDRTGAGDSFSATFTVAIALGKSIREALMWGPINSMSVVQYIGAQAGHLTRAQIEEYLKKAPADYTPKEF